MTQPRPSELEALDRLIDSALPPGDPALPPEAALATALLAAANSIQPDVHFAAALEKRLVAEASLKAQAGDTPSASIFNFNLWRDTVRKLTPIVVFTSLIIALLLGAVALLNRSNSQPASTATASPAPSATLTPLTALPQPTQSTASPQPTQPAAQPEAEQPPRLAPGVVFPTSPEQARVYFVDIPQEPSLEMTEQLAAQFGMSGNVPLEAGGSSQGYVVVQGDRQLFVTTSLNFSYLVGAPDYRSSGLPFGQQTQIVEDFLRTNGFDFAYRVSPSQFSNGVSLEMLIDGLPLLQNFDSYDTQRELSFYRFFGQPLLQSFDSATVFISPSGKVGSFYFKRFNPESVGQYPIRSAQEAWGQVLTDEYRTGMRYVIHPESQLRWLRTYPDGKPVEIYSEIIYRWPPEPGSPPSARFDYVGSVDDHTAQEMASSINIEQMAHLWGQFQEEASGKRTFVMTSWAPSSQVRQTLTGVIHRQGEISQLVTDSETLLLPDLPADLADGVQVRVAGVRFQQEKTLEWSSIDRLADWHTVGEFPGVENPNTYPTPVPSTTPTTNFHIGQTLEGVAGMLKARIHQHLDGSETQEAFFSVEAFGDNTLGFHAALEGPATVGIEQYHLLPIKIWGEVTQALNDQNLTIRVDRYEPVYPELQVKAWLGRLSLITLEGQDVTLFTALDGKQYVLGTGPLLPSTTAYIYFSQEIAQRLLNDQLLVEGVVIPEHTLGGYSILSFMGGQPDNRASLDGYERQFTRPGIEGPMDKLKLRGNPTIEKIELVYIVDGSYAQPIWRFIGHLDDGQVLEIQVQALP